jgi:hypothetical protein
VVAGLPEEVDRPFEYLQPPEPNGGNGNMTYESRIVAWTLRHAHTLFDDEPEQLGWRVISNVLYKSNGERPSFQNVAKTISKLEDTLKATGSFKRPVEGVGRRPVIPNHQKNQMAECLMHSKEVRGFVPTVFVAGRNPDCFTNPSTEKAVSASTCARVMKTKCFDEDPADPWQFIAGLKLDRLSPQKKLQRATFGSANINRQTDEFWGTQVVCLDPVPKILPKTVARLAQVGFESFQSIYISCQTFRVMNFFFVIVPVGELSHGCF